jgi:hypothetical protein
MGFNSAFKGLRDFMSFMRQLQETSLYLSSQPYGSNTAHCTTEISLRLLVIGYGHLARAALWSTFAAARSLAGIPVSNPAWDMDVYVL